MSSRPEPEWTNDELELMLAWDHLDRNTGRQGEYLPEATDPRADPNEYQFPWRYELRGPFTNWAEKTAADALDALRKELGESANLNGVYFTAERVEY